MNSDFWLGAVIGIFAFIIVIAVVLALMIWWVDHKERTDPCPGLREDLYDREDEEEDD